MTFLLGRTKRKKVPHKWDICSIIFSNGLNDFVIYFGGVAAIPGLLEIVIADTLFLLNDC